MAIHLSPSDLTATDHAGIVPRPTAERRWSPAWIAAVLLVTLVVDVLAVWGVLTLLGPLALLTFVVLAVGGLYLVATRTSTTSR